jgi:hypothetical protein
MYRNSIHLIGAAIVAFAIGGSGAAFAQGTMQQQDGCRPDVFRLCSNYIPNVGEIVACLRGNEPRLSESCRQVMFPDQAGHEQYQKTGADRSDEIQ